MMKDEWMILLSLAGQDCHVAQLTHNNETSLWWPDLFTLLSHVFLRIAFSTLKKVLETKFFFSLLGERAKG